VALPPPLPPGTHAADGEADRTSAASASSQAHAAWARSTRQLLAPVASRLSACFAARVADVGFALPPPASEQELLAATSLVPAVPAASAVPKAEATRPSTSPPASERLPQGGGEAAAPGAKEIAGSARPASPPGACARSGTGPETATAVASGSAAPRTPAPPTRPRPFAGAAAATEGVRPRPLARAPRPRPGRRLRPSASTGVLAPALWALGGADRAGMGGGVLVPHPPPPRPPRPPQPPRDADVSERTQLAPAAARQETPEGDRGSVQVQAESRASSSTRVRSPVTSGGGGGGGGRGGNSGGGGSTPTVERVMRAPQPFSGGRILVRTSSGSIVRAGAPQLSASTHAHGGRVVSAGGQRALDTEGEERFAGYPVVSPASERRASRSRLEEVLRGAAQAGTHAAPPPRPHHAHGGTSGVATAVELVTAATATATPAARTSGVVATPSLVTLSPAFTPGTLFGDAQDVDHSRWSAATQRVARVLQLDGSTTEVPARGTQVQEAAVREAVTVTPLREASAPRTPFEVRGTPYSLPPLHPGGQ